LRAEARVRTMDAPRDTLSDYLEEALAHFNLSCDDFERDRLSGRLRHCAEMSGGRLGVTGQRAPID
jgi:hypothetical protein